MSKENVTGKLLLTVHTGKDSEFVRIPKRLHQNRNFIEFLWICFELTRPGSESLRSAVKLQTDAQTDRRTDLKFLLWFVLTGSKFSMELRNCIKLTSSHTIKAFVVMANECADIIHQV